MKKAQSEIITTVLLVLIALAAVAIIAAFIINQVKTNTASAEAKANCLKADVQISSALKATKNIVVMNAGSITSGTLKASVNGVAYGASAAMPASLATVTIAGLTTDAALNSGDVVEVGVILADGTVCATKSKLTVA